MPLFSVLYTESIQNVRCCEMDEILALSEKNQKRAREIITETGLVGIWESAGAEVNLVGSLRTGLLMKNRDIDFHIYSEPLTISGSFEAMRKLAEKPGIQRIEYQNLLDHEDRCIEWHAWYHDISGDIWQIDMIHIMKDSPYAGYFEKVAERISERLTPETRNAILSIKYEVPSETKVMGIEIYKAVLEDGVRTYADFMQWKDDHPEEGIIEWMP